MPPTPQASPNCDNHARRLADMEERLERGDAILASVKRIEIALVGDPEMGITGIVELKPRVESLEKWRTWLAGAVAGITALIGVFEYFRK